MSTEDNKKQFRFRLSDKGLIKAWADHNNLIQNMDLEPPKQVAAVTDFLVNVFRESIKQYKHDMRHCPVKDIAGLEYVMGTEEDLYKPLDSWSAEDKVKIYRYMSGRTYKRCLKLMDKLEAEKNGISMPKYFEKHKDKHQTKSTGIDWNEMVALFK